MVLMIWFLTPQQKKVLRALDTFGFVAMKLTKPVLTAESDSRTNGMQGLSASQETA